MRLIDLDAVIEVKMYDEEHEKWSLKKMTVEDYLSDDSEIPPIVEERKKGKWIKNEQYDDLCKCSSCGREVWYPWGIDVFAEKNNFCSNCGADMRGEEK